MFQVKYILTGESPRSDENYKAFDNSFAWLNMTGQSVFSQDLELIKNNIIALLRIF